MESPSFLVVELAALDADQADHAAEVLAQWHVREWGHLYRPEVWNLVTARSEFTQQIDQGAGQIPTTYVALTDGGQLVGSVSLVPSDDLDGFAHLGPWLASLYVDEVWRGRGIGAHLITHLLAQPPAQQSRSVYLFTADHASWYTELGWEELATTTSGPDHHPVTVMVRSTTEVEGSAPPLHPTV